MTGVKKGLIARALILILLLQIFGFVFPGRSVLAVNTFDRELFRVINSEWKSPVMDKVMYLSTYLGDGFIVLGVLGGLYLYGERTENENFLEAARVGFAAFTKSGILAQIGKYIFQRPRPGLSLEDVNYNGPAIADKRSFPSGHTTAAFSLATVLAEEFPAHKKWFYTGAWLAGISRIYNGVHYPTDVLAGAILGYLIGKRAFNHKFKINEDGYFVYVFSF